jgi:hypothetical protein
MNINMNMKENENEKYDKKGKREQNKLKSTYYHYIGCYSKARGNTML